MKYVQKTTDDQVNRRNNLRHWKKTRFVFLEISIRRKIRQCSLISQKSLNENDFLKITFAIKTLLIKNDQSIEKNWWD